MVDAIVTGEGVPAYHVDFWLGKLRSYCVVVPVINEGERIVELLKRMLALGIDSQADVIIADGGSTDGSLGQEMLRQHGVRGLLIKKGKGRLSAQLRCAYSFAMENGYDGIITIDGNNKDDPAAITEFIKQLDEGVDFVQASRYVVGGVAENTPAIRDFAIKIIHAPLLSFASGFRWTDTTQGFRAYSRRLIIDPRVAMFRDIFTNYELLAYLSYRAPRLGFKCVEIGTKRSYPIGKVPTKISAVRGNLELIKVLVLACLGRYDP